MKITEIILVPSKSQDTTSCGTTSSITPAESAQDIVSQDIVEKNRLTTMDEHDDHSAIAEGVSQILRRNPKKGLSKGFRCTTGPRKGRIVAKPATCFAKRDPVKGAKIKKKRQMKARQAGKKMAMTKRSAPTSRRLSTVQTKKKSSSLPTFGAISSRKPLQRSGGKRAKSKIVKPKK
jgi:hypothetical protein